MTTTRFTVTADIQAAASIPVSFDSKSAAEDHFFSTFRRLAAKETGRSWTVRLVDGAGVIHQEATFDPTWTFPNPALDAAREAFRAQEAADSASLAAIVANANLRAATR